MADALADSSSLKVPYNLRPSKQAERRMLLDLYQGLMSAGFPVTKYHYVGFGSIFFVDFRILHKLLRIKKMTSIEGFKSLWKRCEYNKPFDAVSMFKGLSSDFIPKLDPSEKYLSWFDYDFPLNKIVADDIAGLTSALAPWSIVILTIDLETPKEFEDEHPQTFYDYFKSELPGFALAKLTLDDFKPPNRERTIIRMMERCFEQGLKGRADLTFEYLVRLTYADGHKMLTVGGIIADASARGMLTNDAVTDLWFLSRDSSGPAVDIPKIVFTQKEVTALEQCLPAGAAFPKNTGLTKADMESFRKFYRYWPSYSEALA